MAVAAARRWWPLALGVLLGVLVGLLVPLLASGVRRAQASVLISSPAGPAAVTPMLPNPRELAASGVVAGNVRIGEGCYIGAGGAPLPAQVCALMRYTARVMTGTAYWV